MELLAATANRKSPGRYTHGAGQRDGFHRLGRRLVRSTESNRSHPRYCPGALPLSYPALMWSRLRFLRAVGKCSGAAQNVAATANRRDFKRFGIVAVVPMFSGCAAVLATVLRSRGKLAHTKSPSNSTRRVCLPRISCNLTWSAKLGVVRPFRHWRIAIHALTNRRLVLLSQASGASLEKPIGVVQNHLTSTHPTITHTAICRLIRRSLRRVSGMPFAVPLFPALPAYPVVLRDQPSAAIALPCGVRQHDTSGSVASAVNAPSVTRSMCNWRSQGINPCFFQSETVGCAMPIAAAAATWVPKWSMN